MNRSRALIGSLALSALLLVPAVAQGAASGPSLWFAGSRLILADGQAREGDLAVPTDDPGLVRFLTKLGATLSYQPGQDYVIVTTMDHRAITFTRGESNFLVEGTRQEAPFSVFDQDGRVYLPFYTLARALDVAPVLSAGDIVLQPQLASLDIHTDGGRSIILLHAAVPPKEELTKRSARETALVMHGVGTSLVAHRIISGPGLERIDVGVTGTPRNPTTTLTFTTPLNSRWAQLGSPDPAGIALAFAPESVALRSPLPAPNFPDEASPVQASIPQNLAPQTALTTQTAALTVTGLQEASQLNTFTVSLPTTGKPSYSWRVLADGRFYIDIHGADLNVPARDETLTDPRVVSLRLRENGTDAEPNVRLALSLRGQPAVRVSNDGQNITVVVGGVRLALASQAGYGVVGQTDAVAAMPLQPVSSSRTPLMPTRMPPSALTSAANSRLIVIDPGHGGSDSGAQGNNLTEKVLTLDIARRLRELLIARGWEVKMTRNSDVDVYAPNDSAHDELQARCDVANNAGARLFVSIHINSFTDASLTGTTTYYYKPQDVGFATIVQNRLIAALGTADDGARRENYYVVRHTTMPSILVETAFLSNPADAARLRSETFRQSVAQAITDGISAYTGGPLPTSRPGAGNRSTLSSADDANGDDLSP